MSTIEWIVREQRRLDELVRAASDWRNQVSQNVESIQSAARGLSELVSQGTALANVVDPRLVAPTASVSILAQLAQQQQATFETLRAALRPALMPAAFASVFELQGRLAKWNERSKEYDAALASLGWWFPPSLPAQAFVEAGQLALKGKRVALRQHMAQQVQGRKAFDLMNDWLDEPLFRNRKRFLLDGARDHRKGRYRVSIPTLLPMVEGIAVEAFLGRTGETNPRGAVAAGVTTYGSAEDQALLETISFLWVKQDFRTFPGSSRLLNRHVVLHGRSTGYGTEANSAMVLFALDHLYALVQVAAKAKAAASHAA